MLGRHGCLRPLLLALLAVAIPAWIAASAHAYTFNTSAVDVDPNAPQPVSAYSWDCNLHPICYDPSFSGSDAYRNTCDDTEYADQPVHAFLDDHGHVQLILANGGDNRRMMGPMLDAVVPEQFAGIFYGYSDARPCDNPVTHDHHYNAIHEFYSHPATKSCEQPRDANRCTPDTFHNKEWLTSVWTADGHTINALMHNEFHGEAYDPNCHTTSPSYCYYSSITSAKSTDSGANYVHAQSPPNHLVATLPYQYTPDLGKVGYASPSNILKEGGAWVAMFIARGCQNPTPPPPPPGEDPADPQCLTSNYVPAQRTGTCAMRTFDLSNPSSWQGSNGGSYNVTFTNPYPNPPADPASHVCVPVNGNGLFAFMSARSMVYDQTTHHYILVGLLNRPEYGAPNGVYFSWAVDPLGPWSNPTMIMSNPDSNAAYCADPTQTADLPVTYPSIIDPSPPVDPGNPTAVRNFEEIDDSGYVDMFYTKNKQCPDGTTNHEVYPPPVGTSVQGHRDLYKARFKFKASIPH
jgi:hypothetical protein